VLDRTELAVAVPAPVRTDLDRSPAFRAYAHRLPDGLAYLTESENVAPEAAPHAAAA
jgi:hypothetical protein